MDARARAAWTAEVPSAVRRVLAGHLHRDVDAAQLPSWPNGEESDRGSWSGPAEN